MTTKSISSSRSRSRGTGMSPAGGSGMKLKTILVPTDFSEESARSLGYAAAFAAQFGGRLIILNVVPLIPSSDLIFGPMILPETSMKKGARIELKAWVDTFRLNPSLSVRLQIRLGQPWREIVDAAESSRAGLVIISTHGRTGLARQLMGSTAEQVVRHAHCPVMVLKKQEPDFVSERKSRRKMKS